jgi:hypothetical protein
MLLVPDLKLKNPGGHPDAHFEIKESSNFYDFKYRQIASYFNRFPGIRIKMV